MSRDRQAFTLVELMVATALLMIIVAVATTASVQMLSVSHRLEALSGLDSQAATTQVKLNGQVTAMHPCAALWLISNKSAQSVEFVFMHSKYSPQDYPGVAKSSKNMQATDMLWTRWYWTAASSTLQVSSSRSMRWFAIDAGQTRNYWQIPGGSKMPSGYSTYFLSVPQMQHDTGTAITPNSPVDLLNSNGWQSGEGGDVGDYDDLLITARPLLYNCTALTVGLQDLDGSTKVADGTGDLQWAVPGSYVDGRSQPGLSDRPGIVRLRFTLNDPRTGATGTYSFSFSTPTFTPY